MREVVEWLRSIPDVIWSGVVASIITLTGVFISNSSNTRRLRLQLHHDAVERQKERVNALRRDVYLKAAEEISRANSYLASLTQLDVTKSNVADGLKEFFAISAKLQLVAEPKTALLVNDLTAAYGELILRLMGDLLPVQEARTDIALSDEYYQRAQSDVNRILGEMKKFTEAARTESHVFDALCRSFDSTQQIANEYAEKRQAAWARFNALNAIFVRGVVGELRGIGGKNIQVLVEIRRDLGLVTELKAYEAQMHAQWERTSAQFDDLMRKLAVG